MHISTPLTHRFLHGVEAILLHFLLLRLPACILQLCVDAQRARGRDAAALEQQHSTFDTTAAKQRNAAKAAEAAARQNEAAIRGVVER